MAENDENRMDYSEHEKSYDLFLWMTKWTVILVVIVLVLMTVFLV